MEDLSQSGTRIRLNRPIRVASEVALVVETVHVQATARYCLRYGSEFIVGMKFQHECQGMLRAVNRDGEMRLQVRTKDPQNPL